MERLRQTTTWCLYIVFLFFELSRPLAFATPEKPLNDEKPDIENGKHDETSGPNIPFPSGPPSSIPTGNGKHEETSGPNIPFPSGPPLPTPTAPPGPTPTPPSEAEIKGMIGEATTAAENASDKGISASVIGTVLMLLGVVGSLGLITGCPNNVSPWVFIGGSFFALYSEIKSYATYQTIESDYEEKMKDIEKKEVPGQLAALNATRAITDAAATWVKSRRDYAIALAAIWGGAAIVALIEFALSFTSLGFTYVCMGSYQTPMFFVGILAPFLAPATAIFTATEPLWRNAWGRAIVFGAFAVIVAAVNLPLLQSAANDLDERVTKLDTVIKELGQLAPAATITQSEVQMVKHDAELVNGVENNTQDSFSNCVASSNQAPVSDPNCTCRANNTCFQAPNNTSTSFQNLNLPGSLTDLIKESTSNVGHMTSGNNGLTNKLSNLLNNGKMANSLKKYRSEILKKINEQQKLKGQQTNDYDSAVSSQLKKMATIARSSVDKLPPEAKAMLAIGTVETNPQEAKTNNSTKTKDSKEKIPSPHPLPAANNDDLNSMFFEEEKNKTQQVPTTIDSAKALDYYQEDYSDVSNKDNKSLFEIINHRYKKTAYPRFFDEIIENKNINDKK